MSEISLLREKLKELNVNEVSEKDLRRVMRYTGYRVYTSAEILRKRSTFFKTNALEDLTVADVQHELKKGYIQYIRGARGHEGRPIIIFRTRHFFPRKDADEATVSRRVSYTSTSTMDFLKTIVFVLNTALKDLDKNTRGDVDGIILFIDMRDASLMKNFDKTVRHETAFANVVSETKTHSNAGLERNGKSIETVLSRNNSSRLCFEHVLGTQSEFHYHYIFAWQENVEKNNTWHDLGIE